MLVWTYRSSSSPAYALLACNHWAHFHFAGEIDLMFPDRVLYDPAPLWQYDPDPAPWKLFKDGVRIGVSREQLEAWAAEGRLYFHMTKKELPPGFRYEAVVPSGGLYQATLPN